MTDCIFDDCSAEGTNGLDLIYGDGAAWIGHVCTRHAAMFNGGPIDHDQQMVHAYPDDQFHDQPGGAE